MAVMLKSLRKNTKVIIWAVILCFALWGGFSIGTQFQKRGRVAGEVFGKEISFQEYNLFYRASRIFNFGSPAPEAEDLLRRKTWQNIIYSHEAKRRKIEVSDEEARREILRLLEDRQIKDPTPEVYRHWLAAGLRQTPQEFESQVREILRIQKLMRKINEEPVERATADEEAALLRFQRAHNLPSEKKFEGTLKEQYLKEFEEQKTYERFLKWRFEVEKRANLKDHLPPLEAKAEPESESPSPPPAPATASAGSAPPSSAEPRSKGI